LHPYLSLIPLFAPSPAGSIVLPLSPLSIDEFVATA
jgi:hypothetical protein